MAELEIRDARAADLPGLVAMLADDPLGQTREDPSLPLAQAYRDAFDAISRSTDHRLIVGCEGGEIVATLQLSFLPGLARRGAWRGQIEAVRVRSDRRGQGHGERLVLAALAACRERGCALVQLTSDDSRPEAHRFWRRLGFRDSHRGFKLALGAPG